MKNRMKFRFKIAVFLFLFFITALAGQNIAAVSDMNPIADNPADHSYPALGISAKRKVPIAWNRFYDNTGLGSILAQLHEAFPDLTRFYSIGKSSQGRDIWCLEVTARNIGDPNRKAAMYIDGNIHGNEVQAAETVVYTAWYLCHQYGQLDKVTSLLDERIFYLIPSMNPDGRDYWLSEGGFARSGLEPTDDDRDGLTDEDSVEDLNGDGFITQMRKKDPEGRLKLHPEYPEYLTVRVQADERGEYSMIGWEGIDNDGDGRINEDGPGGYDLNRNWAYDWQPDYIQGGAKDYPFSQPETQSASRFVLSHPNIAAAQSYHNSGGMILRSPGREGGEMHSRDERVLRYVAERGEKILPFYRSMIVWSDLYTVWGGELDWFYGGLGILTFTNELWTSSNLYKSLDPLSDEQEAEFIKYVLMDDGLVPWRQYEHPIYGTIEIGGLKKEWGRTPPSFLLEEELHRNMAFTLYHADMMPLIKISEVQIEELSENLYKIWVTIENDRLIPTRTAQDVANHINSPDIVSIQGNDLHVLSGGEVTDRYFKRAQAVKRRPERVELDTILGMGAVRVQFIVEGEGRFSVTVDSVKGGLHSTSQVLP